MNAPEQHDMLVCRVNSMAIKLAHPFIAENDVRYYLCGVNIRPLEDGTAMVVATDGVRFIIIRDPAGYAETEVISHISKDAIWKGKAAA